MTKKHRALSFIFSLFLLVSPVAGSLVLEGCAHKNVTVSNLPTGISEAEVKNWYTATGTLWNISQVSGDIQDKVISWNRVGAFPDGPEYAATIRALGRVQQTQIIAANYLKTTPQTFGKPVQEKIHLHAQDIEKAFNDLNSQGTLGIKNEASKVQFSQLVAQLRVAVELLLSLTSAVKGQ